MSDIKETDLTATNTIDCDKRNVVITGFGLFRDHQTNPSWEAIKDGRLGINRSDLNIITKRISVSYDEVDEVVPALWEEYKPILMVHVGLAAHHQRIGIEQVARHGPYLHDDVFQQAPHKNLRLIGAESMEENVIKRRYSCKPCKFDCSKTSLNIERVCDIMNKARADGKIALRAEKSVEAGLYVCEYIYQKSLRICDKAVFIHVPDASRFSLEDIRASLKLAIEALIDEVLC